MLKFLSDRDTNKVPGQVPHQCINKYKAKLINKHENKRIDKYKTKYIKKYILQPLPQVQPLHPSHAILALPQHRIHAAPTPPPHLAYRSNAR